MSLKGGISSISSTGNVYRKLRPASKLPPLEIPVKRDSLSSLSSEDSFTPGSRAFSAASSPSSAQSSKASSSSSNPSSPRSAILPDVTGRSKDEAETVTVDFADYATETVEPHLPPLDSIAEDIPEVQKLEDLEECLAKLKSFHTRLGSPLPADSEKVKATRLALVAAIEEKEQEIVHCRHLANAAKEKGPALLAALSMPKALPSSQVFSLSPERRVSGILAPTTMAKSSERTLVYSAQLATKKPDRISLPAIHGSGTSLRFAKTFALPQVSSRVDGEELPRCRQ